MWESLVTNKVKQSNNKGFINNLLVLPNTTEYSAEGAYVYSLPYTSVPGCVA